MGEIHGNRDDEATGGNWTRFHSGGVGLLDDGSTRSGIGSSGRNSNGIGSLGRDDDEATGGV